MENYFLCGVIWAVQVQAFFTTLWKDWINIIFVYQFTLLPSSILQNLLQHTVKHENNGKVTIKFAVLQILCEKCPNADFCQYSIFLYLN